MNKQTVKNTIEEIESLLFVLKQQLNIEEENFYEENTTEYIPYLDDDVEYYDPGE